MMAGLHHNQADKLEGCAALTDRFLLTVSAESCKLARDHDLRAGFLPSIYFALKYCCWAVQEHQVNDISEEHADACGVDY